MHKLSAQRLLTMLIGVILIATFFLAVSSDPTQSVPQAYALGGGDVAIRLITGNDATGLQELVSDSNSCLDGPHAAYVGVEITNTSAGTLDGLTATITNFDVPNGFDLAGG